MLLAFTYASHVFESSCLAPSVGSDKKMALQSCYTLLYPHRHRLKTKWQKKISLIYAIIVRRQSLIISYHHSPTSANHDLVQSRLIHTGKTPLETGQKRQTQFTRIMNNNNEICTYSSLEATNGFSLLSYTTQSKMDCVWFILPHLPPTPKFSFHSIVSYGVVRENL